MTTYETYSTHIVGEVKVEYRLKYKVRRQTEECHGFHDMYDMDEVEKKLVSVSIVLSDHSIDITNFLDKDTKKILENALDEI